MINDDTIKLLRECNAGIKMGITSIDDVITDVNDHELKRTLEICKKEHEKLGIETEEILNDYDDEGKEPNPMAKACLG